MPGRLLVIDYQHPEPDRTESMMFVFDGGVADSVLAEKIRLPPDELRSHRSGRYSPALRPEPAEASRSAHNCWDDEVESLVIHTRTRVPLRALPRRANLDRAAHSWKFVTRSHARRQLAVPAGHFERNYVTGHPHAAFFWRNARVLSTLSPFVSLASKASWMAFLIFVVEVGYER